MRLFALLVSLSCLASPAAYAQMITQDEHILTDIIFGECMPYFKEGIEPFSNYDPVPMSAAEIARRTQGGGEIEMMARIFDGQYLVLLGERDGQSQCSIIASAGFETQQQLVVNPNGFLSRMQLKAAAIGLEKVKTTTIEERATITIFYQGASLKAPDWQLQIVTHIISDTNATIIAAIAMRQMETKP